MNNILFLASSSSSRQQLLKDAAIPYMIVQQDADEKKCDWALPLQQVVERIAVYKMEHVIMPIGTQGQCAYVLTADTLSQNVTGTVVGKPASKQEAVEQIVMARSGMVTGTAFCLEKKIYRNNTWQTSERIVRYVQATYQFNVPDAWVEQYFALTNGYLGCGAIAIDGFGTLFLKELQGSYSAVVGLPLFELRESLTDLGFFPIITDRRL